MFRLTSDLYDRIYEADGKDYASEVKFFQSLIDQYLPSAHRNNKELRLIDFGCGTGKHLELFQSRYKCFGLDLDSGLLGVALSRCKHASLFLGDMAGQDLPELLGNPAPFDVALCLFSAIGYLTRIEKIQQFFFNISSLLSLDGIAIIEPWLQPGQWDVSHIGMVVVNEPSRKIVRINTSGQCGNVSIVELHYTIGTVGGVKTMFERHEIAMYSWDDLLRIANNASLHGAILNEGPSGHGIIILSKSNINIA